MIATQSVTIDDYHASEFVSHSKMRTFADIGPFGYRARHLLGESRREATDAMRFGQAFETFVQEPDVFAARYKELPEIEGKADDSLLAEAAASGVMNDGKPFTKRHDAKTVHLAIMRARGGDVMTRADMVRIERMAESFARNTDAQEIARSLDTQITLREDFGGLDMLPGIQARPDWYGNGGMSADLKTCAQFGDFDRTIIGSGYHTQAALIDMITGIRTSRMLIAVESEWPYRCQVVDLPHDVLELGVRWCRRVLDEMRECYARDAWPLCAMRRTMAVKPWMTNGE